MTIMQAQAEALGLPLEVCTVGPPYLDSYGSHISGLRERHGITRLVTGGGGAALLGQHHATSRKRGACDTAVHAGVWTA
jgi:hypothetical protein